MTNTWVQLRYQLLVEGLLERELVPGRLLRTKGAAPLEERVAKLLAALDP